MGRRKKNEKMSTKERMKRYREKKSEEDRAQCREKDKLRKAKKSIEMTEEEHVIHRKKDKERKSKKRKEIKLKAQMEKERKDKEWDAEFYRDASIKRRSEMSDVKHEYERITQLLRNRKERAERNGKKHLLDNLKAKKGMQIFKEEGRIKKFDQRLYYKRTELSIWREYREIGPAYKEWLEIKNPEISKIFDNVDEKLNKEIEDDKQKKKEEEEQKKKEEEENSKKKEQDNESDSDEPDGYWGVQHGDWHWYGEGDPPPADQDWPEELTKDANERYKDIRIHYEGLLQNLLEERREEAQKKKEETIMKRRECQKRYYKKKKKALQEDRVEMPELGEKSAYLLLQEKNIEELEQRKKASGLFDDDT